MGTGCCDAVSSLVGSDSHLMRSVHIALIRPFPENRYRAKKKAFTKAAKKWQDDQGKKEIEKEFQQMKKYCKVIRIIAHTQVNCAFNRRQELKEYQWSLKMACLEWVRKLNSCLCTGAATLPR